MFHRLLFPYFLILLFSYSLIFLLFMSLFVFYSMFVTFFFSIDIFLFFPYFLCNIVFMFTFFIDGGIKMEKPLTTEQADFNKIKEAEDSFNEKRFNKDKEPRRITVGITKGGASKTTTATHLATGLARKGRKVLLIDTDPQGQCATMLGETPFYTLSDVISGESSFEDSIIKIENRLHLLGSNRSLKLTEATLLMMEHGGEEMLDDILFEQEKNYDYIIIDQKPTFGLLNVNAFFYANEILIPFELKPITFHSLNEFIGEYEPIRKRIFKRYREAKLKLKYILPAKADKTLLTKETMDAMNDYVKDTLKADHLGEEYTGIKVLNPIPRRTVVPTAVKFGQTVFDYHPRNQNEKNAKKIVTNAFNKVIEEVIADE